MICVQLSGGLGNQMFQYACGRSLSIKNRTELVLEISQLKNPEVSRNITSRQFELDKFKLTAKIAESTDLKKLKPLYYKVINTLLYKTGFHGIQASEYFIEHNYSFNKSIKNVSKDCYLSGYWQSYLYFVNIETILHEDFCFINDLTGINLEISNRMARYNSVSLHIRRRDFISNINIGVHGSCSLEYYKKAVDYISTYIKDPYFFIFSDDIEWTLENLQTKYPFEIITHNTGENSFIDMHLMSLCKHNIIANSTFSWWGAWLNSNPEKVVIAPKQWFSDTKLNHQTKDLIPMAWMRL